MILEEATFETFGYYPSNLTHGSHKPILAACDNCGKVREASKNNYHALCKSCSMKGRVFTEERNQKISEGQKGNTNGLGHICTEEAKHKMSESRKGVKLTEEWKHKLSVSAIKRIHNSPPAMTAPEKVFDAICIKNDLPFECNVDAKCHIGNAIPDFIHTSKKVVVEVFGDYYHSSWGDFKGITYVHTVGGRTAQLKAEGYKTIFIWESDLMRPEGEAFVMHLMQKEKII